MRYQLLLISLVACTQGQDAKDFYDHTQTGTSWQLAIADAQIDQGFNPGPGHYIGGCPAFADQTVRVPDGSASCAPGCTCTLTFYLEDDGDVGHSYHVDADYRMDCGSTGPVLDCIAPDPETGEIGWCTWGPNPSTQACKYTFSLVEAK
jgi:hypothetical protein